jgi:thioredoxin-related protein
MTTQRLVLVGLISLMCMSFTWGTNFDKAKTDARATHKLILLKFSGSDWCLPCIRMEKEVFSKDSFTQFAEQQLEMVNADFPRTKKHELDKATRLQNDKLAELYNKDGHFPYLLLLDAEGKVLKTWDGYKGQKPEVFIQEISHYVSAN